MGFIVDGSHDEKLTEDGWISVKENPPKDYIDVYLRCSLMMDEFVVIGQLADGKRIKSDGDPDAFYRSAILFWKPLPCTEKECEPPYGGKEDCELLRSGGMCSVN